MIFLLIALKNWISITINYTNFQIIKTSLHTSNNFVRLQHSTTTQQVEGNSSRQHVIKNFTSSLGIVVHKSQQKLIADCLDNTFSLLSDWWWLVFNGNKTRKIKFGWLWKAQEGERLNEYRFLLSLVSKGLCGM